MTTHDRPLPPAGGRGTHGYSGVMSRHELDRALGLFGTFDDPRLSTSYTPRRLRLLWIENSPLDCRIWSYYCDIRDAMARLHELCTPKGTKTCLDDAGTPFAAEAAVVGPRYSINVASDDEPLGIDRPRHARLPLLVLQNKMYTPHGWREIVGDLPSKLRWAHTSGAVAAFTWLAKYRVFTRASGVPHHWLPFGVDPAKFSRHAGSLGIAEQPFDVGFTGASGVDKYPLRRALLDALHEMNVSLYTGSWVQTSLNRQDNRSWKAGNHDEYAQSMASTKIWLSTTGPEWIVGTRYFEVLASGTTLLLCNRPLQLGEQANEDGEQAQAGARSEGEASWQRSAYDGLFEDGRHVVFFDDVSDMRSKVLHYLRNDSARRLIVRAAHALALRLHTWDARARFVSWVAEEAIRRQANSTQAFYAPPLAPSNASISGVAAAAPATIVGCFAFSPKLAVASGIAGWQEPSKSRNRRKLHRYTVRSCHSACATVFESGHFGLHSGGFSTGNAHILGRCFCTKRIVGARSAGRPLPSSECATTCSLHDPRPCGGPRAIAVYAFGGIALNGSTSTSRRRGSPLEDVDAERQTPRRTPIATRAPRRAARRPKRSSPRHSPARRSIGNASQGA